MWVSEDPVGRELAWTFALVLARVLPVTLITPYLGGRLVPWTARIGLGLVLAGALLPGLAAVPWPSDVLAGALSLSGELLLGAAVGFVASLMVYAAVIAGAVIDASRGQREPALPDLLGGGTSGPTARLLVLLVVVVFLALNGHHHVLVALGDSLTTIAPGSVVMTADRLGPASVGLVALMAAVFELAVMVSLPVLAALLLVVLALGVAGRWAPRLHAFFLALPLRALLGLFVLLISLSLMVEALVNGLGGDIGFFRTLFETLGA